MKKSLLASAIAVGLGTTGAANALTVTITQMNFNGLHGATGAITSAGTGTFTSTGTFFGQPWTAQAMSFFSSTGANTWAGTAPAGAYSYNFSLTGSQVAWGTLFDWNSNPLIPVLNIMTCTSFSTGGSCTGTGTPMQTPPFSGQAPAFNGVVTSASVSAIPVPAAAWLFGSGLVGLAGVARRNKKA